MPTFPKLQRNISYKNYLIDILLSFIIVFFNSSFIYVPLFIGLVISLNFRLSFVFPFLFFTEITHNYIYLSLIVFYLIYKRYLYPFLFVILNKSYINIISIIFVYFIYFLFLTAFYVINDIEIDINYLYILYYILTEELLLFFINKELK